MSIVADLLSRLGAGTTGAKAERAVLRPPPARAAGVRLAAAIKPASAPRPAGRPTAPAQAAESRAAATTAPASPGGRRLAHALYAASFIVVAGLLATLATFVVRDGAEPGGTHLALKMGAIEITGPIQPAALWRFTAYLALTLLVDADGVTEIRLDSTGGNLDAALAIARGLDLASTFTRVQTTITPGGTCQSACVAIFAAGSQRRAAADALLMIHAPRFAGPRADAGHSGRVEQAAERRYLDRIEAADPALVSALRRTGAFDRAEPTWLRAGELVAGGYPLVTTLDPPPEAPLHSR